jgi:hypothetical protein
LRLHLDLPLDAPTCVRVQTFLEGGDFKGAEAYLAASDPEAIPYLKLFFNPPERSDNVPAAPRPRLSCRESTRWENAAEVRLYDRLAYRIESGLYIVAA